jgi:endoglucanase
VLVDNGKTVRLLGVDHSGSEYECIQGHGIFDGPADQTAATAVLSWNANAVRVPLNEDCWLGINGAPAQYSGSNYQTAISGYVSVLRQNGLYVILDLHWNAGGTNQATGQQEMADSDHAPAFWTSVASTFMSDQGVVFDLYNEPNTISWSCWLNGGCDVSGWPVAGMNQLIMAVRNAGANNVVMAGGLSWAGDLSQWLANKPTDPANNLAASFHSYNFSNCNAMSCWTSQLQPVAAVVPIITGELGEDDCDAASQYQQAGPNYINGFMTWADGAGVSYLGWAWNPDFSECGGPSLNSNNDWSGNSPSSPFGTDFKTHLMAVNP